MPKPSADHPSRGHGAHRWLAEIVGPGGLVTRVLTVETSAYPNRSRQRMSEEQALSEAGDAVVVTTTLVDNRVTNIRLGERLTVKAPRLWWAEIRESAARPPAVNLLAFTGFGVEEGALLDATALSDLPVVSSDQLAAVRWYPATGEVDQVYVHPDRRRQGIASCLLRAASALTERRDWPRFWGDGQRTELGEALREASPWRDRTAPLSHLAPPMTPPP